jgi:regulator of replication initiation timing
MTDEDSLLLNELKINIKRLFSKYNELEAAYNILNDKVSVLKQQIATLEQEKAELSRENEKIVIANQILSKSDENREAKKKINIIIREIDKCIALLNR